MMSVPFSESKNKVYSEPVITNYLIPPHPLLQPHVDNYLLSSSGGNKISIVSPWPASNETSLVFYLVDQPFLFSSDEVSSPLQYSEGCLVGLQSRCNGTVSFNGVYHTFIIQFKANGFSKIFGLPAAELVDKMFYLDAVFGKQAKHLNESLQSTADIRQMTKFADAFLLHALQRQNNSIPAHDGITFIANELFNKQPQLSIEAYARKACMSVRNFGRKFTLETGVSPKFYCRLLRFNNAVNLKIKKPEMHWTAIAHDCGYFDQMHMIKDFRQFANSHPTGLFDKNNDIIAPKMEEMEQDDENFKAHTGLVSERFINMGQQ